MAGNGPTACGTCEEMAASIPLVIPTTTAAVTEVTSGAPAKTDFILPPSMSSMCLSGIHFHQGSPLEHTFLPLSTTGIPFVKLVGKGSGQVKGSAGGQYSSSPKGFALQLIFGPLDPFQHLCAAASNQGPSSSGTDGTVCKSYQ